MIFIFAIALSVITNFSLAFAQVPEQPAKQKFMHGATVCDFLAHQTWGGKGVGWAPLRDLKEHGVDWVRIGVNVNVCPELQETEDWEALPWRGEFWSCREFAGRIARMAADENMHLCVFLFLSDNAAYAGWQPRPKAWKDLSFEELCQQVEAHSAEVAQYFKDRGLTVEAFEIGNEIEMGLLGYPIVDPNQPIDWTRMLREEPGWLHENVWRQEAELLKAGIRSIKRVNPEAKIGLHISTSPPPRDTYIPAFFKSMKAENVDFDYAGLSIYPYLGEGWEKWREFVAKWITEINTLQLPVVITEIAYPLQAMPQDNVPPCIELPGYPFTPRGQADFLADFTQWCHEQADVQGIFFFYADHVAGVIPNPIPGLFLPGNPPEPAPGLSALGEQK